MTVQPRRAAAASVTDPVRLSGVGFGYIDGPEVLRDVNLNLPAGSFHFLTGPSGVGKSTLLKLITLLERPREGEIELFGRDATRASRRDIPAFRRRMGLVFQDFRLLDHLSAADNVALPLRLAATPARQRDEDVAEILRWVGLGEKSRAHPPTLSGGEKQRLAIARAVVTRPSLIVADEPTGSVDAAMGERLMKLFQAMNRLGATVLIATHDETLAHRVGGRTLRLHDGRLSDVAA